MSQHGGQMCPTMLQYVVLVCCDHLARTRLFEWLLLTRHSIGQGYLMGIRFPNSWDYLLRRNFIQSPKFLRKTQTQNIATQSTWCQDFISKILLYTAV